MRVASKDINGFDMPAKMYAVADWPDEGILLEIGTLQGKSAVAFAEAFEECGKQWEIYTVDAYDTITWKRPEPITRPTWDAWLANRHLGLKGDVQERVVRQNIKGWPNIYQIKQRFNKDFSINKEPTALFYDADHEYEPVRLALEMYSHLKYIIVDDYHKTIFPGTVQAVDEHVKEHNKKVEILFRTHEGGVAVITTKEE